MCCSRHKSKKVQNIPFPLWHCLICRKVVGKCSDLIRYSNICRLQLSERGYCATPRWFCLSTGTNSTMQLGNTFEWKCHTDCLLSLNVCVFTFTILIGNDVRAFRFFFFVCLFYRNQILVCSNDRLDIVQLRGHWVRYAPCSSAIMGCLNWANESTDIKKRRKKKNSHSVSIKLLNTPDSIMWLITCAASS